MVDRQELDALLVGALYGELTPAEEQRLSAHLDSHPADRTALEDMTRARDALRESRILTVQLDPPQAVSARLLQEAARRAPKAAAKEPAHEGWLSRFLRSFAARPMMAAAATLVLVLGIAGSVYLRGDGEVPMAENLAAREAADEGAQGAPAASGAGMADPEAARLMLNAGSAFSATLNDDVVPTAPAVGGADQAALEQAKNDSYRKDKSVAPARRPHGAAHRDTYLSVETARPQPKELDEDRAERGRAPRPAARAPVAEPAIATSRGTTAGVGAGAAAEQKPDVATDASGAVGNRRPQPGPTVAAPPPPPVAPQAAPRSRDAERQKQEVEDTAWARGVHERVVAAVAAHNCAEAGRLAATLAQRAPTYYATNVEPDRRLKPCVPYLRAQQQQQRR